MTVRVGTGRVETAAALRASCVYIVQAPVRDLSGELVREMSAGWDVRVFRFLEGRNPDFFGAERVRIAAAVGRLHTVTGIRFLRAELNRSWMSGQYCESARAPFVSCDPGIRRLAAAHQRLVERLRESSESWVITQGEGRGDRSDRVITICRWFGETMFPAVSWANAVRGTLEKSCSAGSIIDN